MTPKTGKSSIRFSRENPPVAGNLTPSQSLRRKTSPKVGASLAATAHEEGTGAPRIAASDAPTRKWGRNHSETSRRK